MQLPQTRYAKSGDLSIAYQVVGDGEFDVVCVPGYVSNLDVGWDMPVGPLYRRIATFARLIIFDKRGTGLSDRNCGMPSLEERMDDVRAVMEAADCSCASIIGFSEGAAMALMFAATYPHLTRSLILWGAGCRFNGLPPLSQQPLDWIDQHWGSGITATQFAPSLSHDVAFRELMARNERSGASPSSVKALIQMNSVLDVSAILKTVSAPTLLLHRSGDKVTRVITSRLLAERLPNSKFIELPGEDHALVGDTRPLFEAIEEFLTGFKPALVSDRVLATVMMTDIVDSTRRALLLGDQKWREVLDRHDQIAIDHIKRYRGIWVKSTGDGVLATFDGPGRAVHCALSLSAAMSDIGLQIRVGLHTGEIEVRDDDIAGIAVHAASRVMNQSNPGEITVSRVVTDLVAGAGLAFSERGSFELKGLPGRWDLFVAAAQTA